MTMTEPRFPVRITRGVPVVIAPDEIDITNAGALRAAPLRAAARPGPVVDMTRTWSAGMTLQHETIRPHSVR